MTCSFKYDGKEFATKQQIVDYINGNPIEEIQGSDKTIRERLFEGQKSGTAAISLLRIAFTDSPYSELAMKVLSALTHETAAEIRLEDNLKDSNGRPAYARAFVGLNLIVIDANKNFPEQVVDATLLHEVIHLFAYQTLESNPKLAARLEELRRIAGLEIARKYGLEYMKSLYGMKDVHEFMSEAFSNLEFIKLLAEIKLSKDKTLWDEFLD